VSGVLGKTGLNIVQLTLNNLKMSAPKELKFFSSVKTGKGLAKLINNLREHRRKINVSKKKRSSLSKKQRKAVLDKTDARCHICGVELKINNFQADHVKSHHSGGTHAESNYLPSCFTCNNYRWHYTSEELQIILRLGVWAKTKIMNDPIYGLDLANKFIKHETGVRNRRKTKQ